LRERGGFPELSNSDEDSQSWLESLGPFVFPTRTRLNLEKLRISDLSDIFYVPNWVSAEEEHEILRRSDAAPPSSWIKEVGRRFQVNADIHIFVQFVFILAVDGQLKWWSAAIQLADLGATPPMDKAALSSDC
jgi:hypothetical protein